MSGILLALFLLAVFGWQYANSKYTKRIMQIFAVMLTVYTVAKLTLFATTNWLLFVTSDKREAANQSEEVNAGFAVLEWEQLLGGIELVILSIALFIAFKVLKGHKYTVPST